MKKIILLIISIIVLASFSFNVQAAANFSFSPGEISAKTGQNFNLSVSIDPQGVKIYTAKVEINFPADLLKPESFSFGPGWMPLSQTEYDLTDNANGILIKTAGYAGGIAGAANFGTITFSAKKEGSGIIKTGDSSMALNADSQNNLSGFSQISFLISKPATPAPSLSPSQKPKLKTPEISPIAGTATLTPSASSSESIDSEINSEKPDFASIQTNPITEEKNFAGIGNIITLGTGNNVLGIIIIMAAIGVIALIVSAIIKRRKKNIQPPAGNSQ